MEGRQQGCAGLRLGGTCWDQSSRRPGGERLSAAWQGRSYKLQFAVVSGGLGRRGALILEPATPEGWKSDNPCPAGSEKHIICPKFKSVPPRQGSPKESGS